MLHGEVKAAICWAIERTRGYVLLPSDLLDESFTTTVMDILCQKHPAPSSDFLSLLKCKPLPHLEDVEKVMCYVLHVGLMVVLVQVVVIPATDLVFYCVMVHTVHSCEMLLQLFPVGWLIQTYHGMTYMPLYISNHLIVLDKYPGITPIGLGEILCRITGKAICSATYVW